jgi:hypothetical protein
LDSGSDRNIEAHGCDDIPREWKPMSAHEAISILALNRIQRVELWSRRAV